jgi:ribosomal-protein-alanine acetyltransferase
MRVADIAPSMEIASSLPEAPQWPPDAYLRALDPESVPVRVALVAEHHEGDIAGFLMTVLIPPQAELEVIAVAKPGQRRGIAAVLFKELLAILKSRQITDVMLEVRESNYVARAFYGSMEFSETGRRRAYYIEPKEDAILLHRAVG